MFLQNTLTASNFSSRTNNHVSEQSRVILDVYHPAIFQLRDTVSYFILKSTHFWPWWKTSCYAQQINIRRKCRVHLPTNAIFYFKKHIKIYIKIHINIAPTCFGLRPSSGCLHWTWLCNIYFKTFGEITSLFIIRLCGSTLPHNRLINNDVISWNLILEYFSKICQENSQLIKTRQEYRVLYTQTYVYLL